MESVQTRLCASSQFAPFKKRPVNSVSSLTRTVTSSTTVTSVVPVKINHQEERQKICHIISTLRNKHLNFNKIQSVHKRKLRYLQNLLRKKNGIIAELVRKLESLEKKTATHKNINKAAHWKYFGVVRCENTIRTIIGNEKFVRRRLAELCTLYNAENLFCQTRANGEKDRQALASLLTAEFGSRVIVYENSRRFEFLNPNEIVNGIHLIIKHLQNESQSDIGAY
ncbi:bv/odv-e26 protein [Thysanoplusia orichalcea nucleopolyhedrovirus]|uniref:Bv/odv-e26 protein n=1 Tax=Thysanoplusia orichalcea nucleopolyhedrovirus TaxID=101850 RepID=L0CLN5_9ABAC|nr:bv/odv-e26 protein [Thysanoplusia orichalcea nucleopolyhedrovirus]AGA16171.1 bv/odv-e26 protein [Thysanoplusia orichalcea nucleopolyhedrovirus]